MKNLSRHLLNIIKKKHCSENFTIEEEDCVQLQIQKKSRDSQLWKVMREKNQQEDCQGQTVLKALLKVDHVVQILPGDRAGDETKGV